MNLGDRHCEQLATRFVDAHQLQNSEHSKVSEEWRQRIPSLVTVLGDFARDGRVERTRVDTARLKVPAAMKKWQGPPV